MSGYLHRLKCFSRRIDVIKIVTSFLSFSSLLLLEVKAEEFFSLIQGEKTYRDLTVKDKRFESILTENPDLYEFGGVRLGKSDDGQTLVIAVGYTIIKNATPKDKIRQLTVTSQNAKAALVGFLEGEYVEQLSKFSEEIKIQSTSQEDTVEISSLYSESMLRKINGKLAGGLERIAFWKSFDGHSFYQALGFVVE